VSAASFTVRPMGEADRPVLLGHVRALNAIEDAIAGNRATGEADAAATLEHVLGRVAGSGGLPLVAAPAAEEGRVVGHLLLTLETAPPYVRPEFRRYAYVADAFVQEGWRGRGAFRAMLAAAEAHARRAGCRHLMIGVLTGNSLAERAYLGSGFRPYALELIREIPNA
jgi:GNAT superfamily N-acetyltransferase